MKVSLALPVLVLVACAAPASSSAEDEDDTSGTPTSATSTGSTEGTDSDGCDAEACESEIETVEIDWGQYPDATAKVGSWGIEEGLLTYDAFGAAVQIAQATCTVVSVTDEGGHFPVRMTTTCVEADEPETDQYDFHETTIWRLPGDVAWGQLEEGQAFSIEKFVELLGPDMGTRGFTRAWDEDGNLLQITVASSSNPPGMPPELHPPGTADAWLEPFSLDVDRCVCAPMDFCSEPTRGITTPFGLRVETDAGDWLVVSGTREDGIVAGDDDIYRMVLFAAGHFVGGDAACEEGNLDGGYEFYTFTIYRLPGGDDQDTGTGTGTETDSTTGTSSPGDTGTVSATDTPTTGS